jgi:hypothetical protein
MGERVGSDDGPLFDEMLRILGPHATALAGPVKEGATASLCVVGEVRGSVVATPDVELDLEPGEAAG